MSPKQLAFNQHFFLLIIFLTDHDEYRRNEQKIGTPVYLNETSIDINTIVSYNPYIIIIIYSII